MTPSRRPDPAAPSRVPLLLAVLGGLVIGLCISTGRLVGDVDAASNQDYEELETFTNGLLRAADHMKAGVLRQLAKSVRSGSFVSVIGTPDHVYADHYDMIACPTMVIVGGRDQIASAEVTRACFYEKIRSADRTFKLYDSIAHGEFEYAPIASDQVYPDILLLDRRQHHRCVRQSGGLAWGLTAPACGRGPCRRP